MQNSLNRLLLMEEGINKREESERKKLSQKELIRLHNQYLSNTKEYEN